MEAKIIRLATSQIAATPGVFMLDGRAVCLTLELPWRLNERSISCIPTGKYICKKTLGRQTHGGMKIPVTYEVTDVPSRSGILFHTGNSEKHTAGCILIGSRFHTEAKRQMILDSRVAFARWLDELKGVDAFNLTIANALTV